MDWLPLLGFYIGFFPHNYADPSGMIACPVGKWDCEAVNNVSSLRGSFLNSASRHNRIPGMDDNGFAALLASVLVSERRIGNVPSPGNPRDRESQQRENFVASLGCTVSGYFVKEAFDNRDWLLLLGYLTNQVIPEGHPLQTRASVGIGNVKLYTALNLWKGQACDVFGNCSPVQVSPLRTTNLFGIEIDMPNPLDPEFVCLGGHCIPFAVSDDEAYARLTPQLLNVQDNIEYVAANLEAGALRAMANGDLPSAFNSAAWHLRGVQTNDEISRIGWPPGAAINILDDIPTALSVLSITSSWSLETEVQYRYWKTQ